MTTNLPDPDLARAFVDGAPGARDALLDAWLPVVLRWAARLGGPAVDCEDAAQDVFIVVLRRLADVEDLEQFGPWLYGVTRRVVSQHRRRAWVRRWMPGASTEQATPEPGPEQGLASHQLGLVVQSILERLPAKQREVLVLCDLEERTAVEAAELIGVPTGTVKSRLRLGRQAFRRLAPEHDLVRLLMVEEAT